MFLGRIRKLFYKSLEEKVDLALNIEKSIIENKEKANELANEFLPMIDRLKHHVKVLGFASEMAKSEFKQVEYISLLDKHEIKLKDAESEYHSKLGEMVRINKSLNIKLDRLMANKGVNDLITKHKEKDSLEKGFNTILDGFDKGIISEGVFSKSFINFIYKYQDIQPIEIENISGYEPIFKSFYEYGHMTLDCFEKAVKLAQEKKVSKVMKEFKAGTLKNNSGKIVTDRDQAIAIAMSEAGLSKSEDEAEIEPEDQKKDLEAYKNKKIKKSLEGLNELLFSGNINQESYDILFEKSKASQLKINNPGSNWKTIKGAKVLIGSGGNIIAGAKGNVGKKDGDSNNKKVSENKGGINGIDYEKIKKQVESLKKDYEVAQENGEWGKVGEIVNKIQALNKKLGSKMETSRKFNNIDSIQNYINNKYENIPDPTLNNDNKKAAGLYRTDDGYTEMNNSLRQNKKPSAEINKAINDLSEAISKSRLKEDTYLYRGVTLNDDLKKALSNLNPGDSFNDKGFSSTSMSDSIVKDFAGNEGVIFEIRAKKGQNALPMENISTGNVKEDKKYRGEVEMLLPANSEFKLVSKEGNKYIFDLV